MKKLHLPSFIRRFIFLHSQVMQERLLLADWSKKDRPNWLLKVKRPLETQERQQKNYYFAKTINIFIEMLQFPLMRSSPPPICVYPRHFKFLNTSLHTSDVICVWACDVLCDVNKAPSGGNGLSGISTPLSDADIPWRTISGRQACRHKGLSTNHRSSDARFLRLKNAVDNEIYYSRRGFVGRGRSRSALSINRAKTSWRMQTKLAAVLGAHSSGSNINVSGGNNRDAKDLRIIFRCWTWFDLWRGSVESLKRVWSVDRKQHVTRRLMSFGWRRHVTWSDGCLLAGHGTWLEASNMAERNLHLEMATNMASWC